MTPVLPASLTPSALPEATLTNFMTDVVEASLKAPILVLFDATWSEASKSFASLLERSVLATQSVLKLFRADIDKVGTIAQQLGIQSVPSVYAFFQGRPVDGFAGPLPEEQLKKWLSALLKATGNEAGPNEETEALEAAAQKAAELLASGDALAAHSLYDKILEHTPAYAPAYAGAIKSLLALKETEAARHLFEQAPAEVQKDKAFSGIATALELAEQATSALPALESLKKKLAETPEDQATRYELAMALYAANDREGAMNELLEMVAKDRKWNDEAARKQLVKFFEAFGPMDDLTISGRRRLSSILFA